MYDPFRLFLRPIANLWLLLSDQGCLPWSGAFRFQIRGWEIYPHSLYPRHFLHARILHVEHLRRHARAWPIFQRICFHPSSTRHHPHTAIRCGWWYRKIRKGDLDAQGRDAWKESTRRYGLLYRHRDRGHIPRGEDRSGKRSEIPADWRAGLQRCLGRVSRSGQRGDVPEHGIYEWLGILRESWFGVEPLGISPLLSPLSLYLSFPFPFTPQKISAAHNLCHT